MTLSFSKENVEKRDFIEKIWLGLNENLNFQTEDYDEYQLRHLRKFFKYWDVKFGDLKAKIHTIRMDKSDRWKQGNKIHFVINNRQPNRFQFTPVVEVKSIQKIRILFDNGPCVYLWENNEVGFMPFAYEGYNEEGLKKLALNDGFDSVEGFFNYFDSDFDGKIIHWTNFKY